MARITVLYAMSLATLLVLVDAGSLAGLANYLNELPVADKVVHFAAFGFLALLVNLSLAQRSTWSLVGAIVIGSMIVMVVATAEELSNLAVSVREYSLGDLAANYLGVLCIGAMPAWAWSRRRRLAKGAIRVTER